MARCRRARALGGGGGTGFPATRFVPLPGAGVNGAARGIAGNLVTQGVSVATGLQKRFDWAGVAVAGVAAHALLAMG